jgi:hypothetical protein
MWETYANDQAFLEMVTGGTRVALLPIGVPVPQTAAVFVEFRERKDVEPPVVGPKPLTIRLQPRY